MPFAVDGRAARFQIAFSWHVLDTNLSTSMVVMEQVYGAVRPSPNLIPYSRQSLSNPFQIEARRSRFGTAKAFRVFTSRGDNSRVSLILLL